MVYNTLGNEPGKENPKTSHGAINRVAGESLILDMVKAVIGETSLMLEVTDKCPNLMLADPSGIGSGPL